MKYEIQGNKLITKLWRNWESSDFLYINSQDRKPLLQSTQKGPAFVPSFYCIFIQIYIWWNLNRSRIFSYNKKEINHFISLSYVFIWYQKPSLSHARYKWHIFPPAEISTLKVPLDNWPQKCNNLWLITTTFLPSIGLGC